MATIFGSKGNGRGLPAGGGAALPTTHDLGPAPPVDLDKLQNAMVPMPPREPPTEQVMVNPLHPLVGELMNQAPIRAIEKARKESLEGYDAMRAELEQHIASRTEWWNKVVEDVHYQAALTAALHLKMRTKYEADARSQADYDSPDLPPAPVADEDAPV